MVFVVISSSTSPSARREPRKPHFACDPSTPVFDTGIAEPAQPIRIHSEIASMLAMGQRQQSPVSAVAAERLAGGSVA
jgi:hypothetical protein